MTTIEVDPDAIRTAWRTGAQQGRDELDAADTSVPDARGTAMAGLTDCLGSAADALTGAATTGRALIDELGDNVDRCLTIWQETNHHVMGQINALEPAVEDVS